MNNTSPPDGVTVTPESDLFFTAPREPVAPLLARFGLELLDPPIAMPVVPVASVWHERFHSDAGLRFLRGVTEGEFEGLLGAGDAPRAGASAQGPRSARPRSARR